MTDTPTVHVTVTAPPPRPIVLSRDTVLDSIAHAFAGTAVDEIARYVLPFGELRWTGWKAAQGNVGIAGQLLLWVYDMEAPRGSRAQRSYFVSLPGGTPGRYTPGDSFFLAELLKGERLSLALHDQGALERELSADFVRAIHALVDFVLADWPEMIALLVWRGINATVVDERRPSIRSAS